MLMGQALAKSLISLYGNIRGKIKRGWDDVRSSANEVLSASFEKVLFPEAVKVNIVRRAKYQFHCVYYTLTARF